LIIGVAALLIAVVIFLRMRSRAPITHERKSPDPAATARLKGDFHAVSIRPGTFSCKAARDLKGRRFLSGSAPRIPLPDCDASDCSCRFAHHADRRSRDERRTPYPSSIGLDAGAVGEEQRVEDDRRSGRADLE
jgi:hypothetical protein